MYWPKEFLAYCSDSDDDWLRLDSRWLPQPFAWMMIYALHGGDNLRDDSKDTHASGREDLQKACNDPQAAMNRLGGPGFDGYFSLRFT